MNIGDKLGDKLRGVGDELRKVSERGKQRISDAVRNLSPSKLTLGSLNAERKKSADHVASSKSSESSKSSKSSEFSKSSESSESLPIATKHIKPPIESPVSPKPIATQEETRLSPLIYEIIEETIKNPKNENIPEIKCFDWHMQSGEKQKALESFYWPNRLTSLISGDSTNAITAYAGDKLIGVVMLTRAPPPAYYTGNAKFFVKMHMKIDPDVGEEYERLLFEKACQDVTKQGGAVILTDMNRNGWGTDLYGGERTRKEFDVSIQVNGSHAHEYLIGAKQGETKSLNYTKVDFVNRNYLLIEMTDSKDSFNHLLQYLKQNPEDINSLPGNLLQSAKQTAKIFQETIPELTALCDELEVLLSRDKSR